MLPIQAYSQTGSSMSTYTKFGPFTAGKIVEYHLDGANPPDIQLIFGGLPDDKHPLPQTVVVSGLPAFRSPTTNPAQLTLSLSAFSGLSATFSGGSAVGSITLGSSLALFPTAIRFMATSTAGQHPNDWDGLIASEGDDW